MNKQIEVKNMAEILCDARHKFVYSDELAEYLYNRGYRKSTDVARGIFDGVDGITDLFAKGIIGELEMYDMLAELKKKYESEGADDDR